MKINNENPVLIKEIREKLQKNKELYGKPFCPCVPTIFYFSESSQDHVCPCKDFRENIPIGETCHCGYWIKE